MHSHSHGGAGGSGHGHSHDDGHSHGDHGHSHGGHGHSHDGDDHGHSHGGHGHSHAGGGGHGHSHGGDDHGMTHKEAFYKIQLPGMRRQVQQMLIERGGGAGSTGEAGYAELASQAWAEDSCDVCGGSPVQRCAACKVARYCSKPCQKGEWKALHKKACKMLQAVAASEAFVDHHGKAPPLAVPAFEDGGHVDTPFKLPLLDRTTDKLLFEVPVSLTKRLNASGHVSVFARWPDDMTALRGDAALVANMTEVGMELGEEGTNLFNVSMPVDDDSVMPEDPLVFGRNDALDPSYFDAIVDQGLVEAVVGEDGEPVHVFDKPNEVDVFLYRVKF